MPTTKDLLLSNMYLGLTIKKKELLWAMYNMSIFMPIVQKVRALLIIFIYILVSITMGLINFTQDLMSKQKRFA